MKTVTEVAQILGVPRQTVHYWIWHKKINALRVGSIYIIEDKEVERAHSKAKMRLDKKIIDGIMGVK